MTMIWQYQSWFQGCSISIKGLKGPRKPKTNIYANESDRIRMFVVLKNMFDTDGVAGSVTTKQCVASLLRRVRVN